MDARIRKVMDTRKRNCMICDKQLEKGEVAIHITQCMYPGTRAGWICDCVKTKFEVVE